MVTARSGEITTVSEATFEEAVLGSRGPVVVYFWARWCPHCPMIAAVLGEIAAERADSLAVCKVDADANPLLTRGYQVMSLPTVLLFVAGQPVRSVVGARSKSRLLAELDDALRLELG
ncbi:thioredoxin 1 [Tamaricihabitans halophyticus]|uniref:Thioredoxin n=1 Tax=Tamaricihabitans halophyticus TaxID=1262583 RepID=A0A4R2QJ28_9PSEU|nr:thioredoxin domain-containing protein [Tamaricihabitans halophyticus]TCP48478.1 thioredoxin 1 [Tamaricihabitans halophyticus]